MSVVCHSLVLVYYVHVVVCHLYVLICTRMSSVSHSWVLVCHLYVTRIYPYLILMSTLCTRISSVCHSYILACHPYVTRMYSYVIRMSRVCSFTMNPVKDPRIGNKWTEYKIFELKYGNKNQSNLWKYNHNF